MFAPSVKETSTTTGTGNFTLGGAVSGYVTFNSVFSNSTTDAGRPFQYAIWSSDFSQWETGVGRLSASGTLVRELPLHTSSGGTASALNFSAGTKYVACTVDGAGVSVGFSACYANTTKIAQGSYGPNAQITSTTSALDADTIYFIPYIHEYQGKVDALLCRITSGAGGNAIGAIYTVGSDGQPGNRLAMATSAVSLAASGIKAMTFTSQFLTPGPYFLAINTNTTGATNTFYQIAPSGNAFANLLGSSATNTCTLSAKEATAYSATYNTAFPQTAGSFSYQDSTGKNPWIGLRAA